MSEKSNEKTKPTESQAVSVQVHEGGAYRVDKGKPVKVVAPNAVSPATRTKEGEK